MREEEEAVAVGSSPLPSAQARGSRGVRVRRGRGRCILSAGSVALLRLLNRVWVSIRFSRGQQQRPPFIFAESMNAAARFPAQ